MSGFQPFELERYQSLHERTVDFNLADSSVKCTGVSDWLDESEIHELLDTGLFYPEVNGTRALRERIAALYPGTDATNVLVTAGAAEAGCLVCETLLEAGDEVVVVSPGYRQVWGLALSRGCAVRELQTRAADDWRPDLEALDALVTPATRLVSIVNPNNPTGTVLTDEEMARIVATCARASCWLHVDEVYAGTEVTGPSAATFRGSYDKLVCVNSMSKAYGLSGLRIGWIVAEVGLIDAFWRRHEYAAISAASPSMTLAEIGLRDDKRAWLLARQRQLSRDGRAVLERWLGEQRGLYRWRPSAATPGGVHRAACRCVVVRSRRVPAAGERRCSLAPGSYLGAEGCLRVTVGYPADKVAAALDPHRRGDASFPGRAGERGAIPAPRRSRRPRRTRADRCGAPLACSSGGW